MASEVPSEDTPVLGNTHARQRGSGHSVVLITSSGPQTQCWEYVRGNIGTRGQINWLRMGCMCASHLSFSCTRKVCL